MLNWQIPRIITVKRAKYLGQQTTVQFLLKQILLWKKFNYEHSRDSCLAYERSVIDLSRVSYICSLAEFLNLATICFGRLCVARKQMWSRGLKSFSGLAPTLKLVKIISWQLLEVHNVSTDNIFHLAKIRLFSDSRIRAWLNCLEKKICCTYLSTEMHITPLSRSCLKSNKAKKKC